MRYPGLREIYYLPASSLPSNMELIGQYAGQQLGDLGAAMIPMHILDGATCVVEESYPNNSYQEKVTIDFATASTKPAPHGSCLVVEFVNGSSRLIGCREHQPSISRKDTTASPSSTNACAWSAELTAKVATFEVKATVIRSDEAELAIIGEVDEITEPAIDEMINNLN